MEDPTKTIRESSRIAVAAFAEFMQAEAGLELNDAQKRLLAAQIDYQFNMLCPQQIERMIDKYLEETED